MVLGGLDSVISSNRAVFGLGGEAGSMSETGTDSPGSKWVYECQILSDHTLSLKLGSSSIELAIVVNLSSQQQFHCGVMDSVEGFKTSGAFVECSVENPVLLQRLLLVSHRPMLLPSARRIEIGNAIVDPTHVRKPGSRQRHLPFWSS